MVAPSKADAGPIVAKLANALDLSAEERAALLRLPIQIAPLPADKDIIREGEQPSRRCALLEDFAATYRVTLEGKRQITAFHVGGDFLDLASLHVAVLDSSVGSLTPCRVAFIEHEHLRNLCHGHPRLADAFWRETLVMGAISRTWVLNLGGREAYARMAHLLCEMVTRLRAVDLARGHACELPITQAEFGEALGISTVHVNRVLKALRADGLISLGWRSLVVDDWEGLKRAGEFDPTYLHLPLDRSKAA